MLLKFVAPFRSHLTLNTHLVLKGNDDYFAFWENVDNVLSQKYKGFFEFKFYHSIKPERELPRYATINTDASHVANPELITIIPNNQLEHFLDESLNLTAVSSIAKLHTFTPVWNSARFHIFDNTIGVFEINCEISINADDQDIRSQLEAVQLWSNSFIEELIQQFYKQYLYQILVEIWQIDTKNVYLDKPGEHDSFPDLTVQNPVDRNSKQIAAESTYIPNSRLMWVNRTAYIGELTQSDQEKFTDHWIMGSQVYQQQFKEDFDIRPVFMGWGHNVICEEADSIVAKDAIRTLILAQYYYAAFDSIDRILSRFVGETYVNMSTGEIRKQTAQLDAIISNVNLLIVQYKMVPRMVQGNRFYLFADLAEKWIIPQLIEDVQEKIDMCQLKLNRLYEMRVNRSQSWIELLLFATGGIALLEFSISLSSYSRELASLPSYGSRGDGVPGLIDLASQLPPDIVIWGALGLLALTLVFFSILRREGLLK